MVHAGIRGANVARGEGSRHAGRLFAERLSRPNERSCGRVSAEHERMGTMCNKMTPLLETWAQWAPDQPPFVLEGDRDVLKSEKSARAIVSHDSWVKAFCQADFCAPGDRKLHLGLLPQPFCGNMLGAKIYFLLLNPGVGLGDYFAEHQVPAFRAALFANLKQRFEKESMPFLFLDPRYAWHNGFGWWHGKLSGVIKRLADHWELSYADARLRLGASVASLELVPYHSASFHDADNWLGRFQSVELARNFVAESIMPRVQSGEAIMIVVRKAAEWRVTQQPGVVIYTPGQARAGHLTPDSAGGAAILRHLGVRD